MHIRCNFSSLDPIINFTASSLTKGGENRFEGGGVEVIWRRAGMLLRKKAHRDFPRQLWQLAIFSCNSGIPYKFLYDNICTHGGQRCGWSAFQCIPLPTFLGFETRLHNKLNMPQNYLKRCESATTYKISIKLSFKSKYYNLQQYISFQEPVSRNTRIWNDSSLYFEWYLQKTYGRNA